MSSHSPTQDPSTPHPPDDIPLQNCPPLKKKQEVVVVEVVVVVVAAASECV
jgi:hypothetical protein